MSKDNIQVIRCPYCGRLYRFYSMMVGDQNGCPGCVKDRHKEADDTMKVNRWTGDGYSDKNLMLTLRT